MLKFTVDGQKLELLGDPHVVADSFDYLTGSFKFYSGYDWDLTEKHVFFQLGEATPYEVTLVDDEFVKTDHVNLTTGVWSIYVIGYDIDGATLVERITTNKVSLTAQISGVQDGEPFPPSIIPDVLIVKDQTTPQTFVNGIPKLASTRVIDLDNELADKKYVDDKVATVTADDFNHNDIDGLQGGSSLERYHMTQAENAALHAHSNKTALDAVAGVNTGDQAASSFNHNDLANKQGGTTNEYYHVTSAEKTVIEHTSGENTGDQDVSGAISGHNTDAGAHAGLFGAVNSHLEDLSNEISAVIGGVSEGQGGVSFSYGKNRFNKTTVSTNKILNTSGALATGTGWITSDYIPVLPSQQITMKYCRFVCEYDVNKAFIAGTYVSNSAGSVYTITTNSATTYVRVSTLAENSATQQVEYGSSASAYYPYLPPTIKKIDGTPLYSDNVINQDLQLKGGGKNLFDRAVAIANKAIGADGVIVTSSGWYTSDYIEVTSGSIITVNLARFVCQYNRNKEGLRGTYVSNSPEAITTITVDSEAKYIRFTTAVANLITAQVEIGSSVTAYETFNYALYRFGTKTLNFADAVDFYKSMFATCVCNGDSLTEGDTGDLVGTPRITSKNYPYHLGRLSGWQVTNKGVSGYTATQWWNANSGTDFSSYDVAFLFLGTNGGFTDTLIADTTITGGQTYLNYANTNTGNYCKIIEKMRSDNPKIKIFIVNVFVSSGGTTTANAVLAQVAAKYSLPIIDINTGAFYGNTCPALYHLYDTVDKIHFSSIGYLHLAKYIFDTAMTYVFVNQSTYEIK